MNSLIFLYLIRKALSLTLGLTVQNPVSKYRRVRGFVNRFFAEDDKQLKSQILLANGHFPLVK